MNTNKTMNTPQSVSSTETVLFFNLLSALRFWNERLAELSVSGTVTRLHHAIASCHERCVFARKVCRFN